jgi:DNA-binding transcriptional ArsR family regulator
MDDKGREIGSSYRRTLTIIVLNRKIPKYMNRYSDISLLTKEELREAEAAQLAELFRALSDPSRVQIVAALTSGELNVGALAETVGISESAVSHHLRGLRQMRLVSARKTGRQVFYSLNDEHIAELYRTGLDHVRHG